MITVGFLAQWGLRSTILIASGAILLKLLKVNDPAVRLAAWTAILCVSLAIPMLTTKLPAMPLAARPVAVLPAASSHAPAPAPASTVFVPAAPATPTPKRFDWGRAAVDGYLLVAGILMLRFALGLVLSLRLLRRSRPTELSGVRESDRIASPVTLGIWRPVIVLPPDWCDWSSARLDAVLAHERSHIARHDPAVQALSAVHRALLWYSPLSWYLDRQIVRLAEQASDDAALAATGDRVSYAETLLAFMRRGVRRASWQGVPMARYGQPEQRIDRILDSTMLSRGITRWTVAAIVAMGLPLAYVIAAAQERLTFEAASVKPVEAGGIGGGGAGGRAIKRKTAADRPRRYEEPTGGPGTSDPGRIHYPMVSARFVLTKTFGVNDFQIAGPDWLDRERYDIDATMAAGTSLEQFRTMLQNLLADRFQMAAHRETRESSGFALVVGKGGPKLIQSADSPAPKDDGAPDPPLKPGADGYFPPPERPGMFLQVTGMPGTADARENFRLFTMPELANILQHQLQRPVADETGLTAKYDFVLNFSGQGINFGSGRIPVSPGDGEPPHQPDIAGALQSQLGLRLEAKKVSQEIIVIDRMEKTPTGN
jgi:uncharacterized protein (TIGR03435 family)